MSAGADDAANRGRPRSSGQAPPGRQAPAAQARTTDMKATRYPEGSARLPPRLSPWRPSLSGGDAIARLRGLIPNLMAVFIAAVFLDSLRYKFTDHPKTQAIFGRL